MKIHLVRHSQAAWQLGSTPDLDSSLTPLGHQQAERLGHWLRESQFEIASLRVSPLRRAQQTAAYVTEALDTPITTQESLREAPFHVADHLPRLDGPLEPRGPYVPSAVYADFFQQADLGLRELVEQAETHGPVMAITHGGFIKTLLRRIIGNDFICFRLYNAALSSIEWRRGRWHFVHLNQWDHLPPYLRTE